MKKLTIPFFQLEEKASIERIAMQMDKLVRHNLDYSLWENPEIKPRASFAIAYDQYNFFLKFYVEEPFIRAIYRSINSEVYRDSCVEFFVGFGDDNGYYNLEFNCLGTCLGQFGADRDDRVFLPPGVLRNIKTCTRIGASGNHNLHTWELTIKIPIVVFSHSMESSIHGNTLRLNFYKCGDDLEEKHYLAWSQIESLEPNFHLPAFFGEGNLESAPCLFS